MRWPWRSAAMPTTAWRLHTQWITALWKGQATTCSPNGDPSLSSSTFRRTRRYPITTHDVRFSVGSPTWRTTMERVDYPRYRRLGLPVTSTLMESLVKEFNLRVKGTEKFWNDPQGAEAILTVRAALLSEDDRFAQFFATRPGCRYRRRSTLKREPLQEALLVPAA